MSAQGRKGGFCVPKGSGSLSRRLGGEGGGGGGGEGVCRFERGGRVLHLHRKGQPSGILDEAEGERSLTAVRGKRGRGVSHALLGKKKRFRLILDRTKGGGELCNEREKERGGGCRK